MGIIPCVSARATYTSTIIAAYMSVEFSRNAFAKGLLQIFSCVTCEVMDGYRLSTVSLILVINTLSTCSHHDVNLGHKLQSSNPDSLHLTQGLFNCLVLLTSIFSSFGCS